MVVKWLEGVLNKPRVKGSNPAEYFEKWVGKFTCRNENNTLYWKNVTTLPPSIDGNLAFEFLQCSTEFVGNSP
jgi:hypothetical protein